MACHRGSGSAVAPLLASLESVAITFIAGWHGRRLHGLVSRRHSLARIATRLFTDSALTIRMRPTATLPRLVTMRPIPLTGKRRGHGHHGTEQATASQPPDFHRSRHQFRVFPTKLAVPCLYKHRKASHKHPQLSRRALFTGVAQLATPSPPQTLAQDVYPAAQTQPGHVRLAPKCFKLFPAPRNGMSDAHRTAATTPGSALHMIGYALLNMAARA